MGEAAEKVVAAAKGYKPDAAKHQPLRHLPPRCHRCTGRRQHRPLEPSAPAAGWMRWLAIIVAVIVGALLLRTLNAPKTRRKAPEAAKPAAKRRRLTPPNRPSRPRLMPLHLPRRLLPLRPLAPHRQRRQLPLPHLSQ